MFPLDFSPRFGKYFFAFQRTCITKFLIIEDAAWNAARDYCAFQESQDGQGIHKEGVVMVTFPPHYTHRLQPIDVAVMALFKAKYAVAQNNWMVADPGRRAGWVRGNRYPLSHKYNRLCMSSLIYHK
jgi:hypothetical protein